IEQGLGGRGGYFAELDRLQGARRQAAREGMDEIGGHLVTLDRNSIQALRSDEASSALREAARLSLASPDEAVRNSGADLNRLADQLLDRPSGLTMTVRQAQDVSEALLNAGHNAFATQGGGSRGRALTDLGRAVRDNARTPERGGFAEYDEWLRRYGTDSDN